MKCGWTRKLLQASWIAIELCGSKSLICPDLVIVLLKIHSNHPIYLCAPCTSIVTATIWKLAECPTAGSADVKWDVYFRDYRGAVRYYAYED